MEQTSMEVYHSTSTSRLASFQFIKLWEASAGNVPHKRRCALHAYRPELVMHLLLQHTSTLTLIAAERERPKALVPSECGRDTMTSDRLSNSLQELEDNRLKLIR